MRQSNPILKRHKFVHTFTLLLLFVGVECTNVDKSIESIGEIVRVTERGEDVVFGDVSAPHEIIMYSSYDCKFCRKFFATTYPELKKKYLDTGKIKLVVKWVDFGEHPEMLNALQAASCISRFGVYDKFHELLNFNPTIIYTTEFRQLLDDIMEENQFIADCILDNDNYEYLKSNLSEFNENKISGTPAFIMNKDIYIGYKTFDRLELIFLKEFNL